MKQRNAISMYVVNLVALATVTAGCESGEPAAVDAAASAITCRDDPRADTFVANLTKQGSAGELQFVLRAADPAPPVKGVNSWELGLEDAAGDPVTNADLTVVPFMPDHGHGTSIVPQITPSADGYTIEPLYLFMPGVWQVTITADAGGDQETAIFNFCIEG